MHLEHMVVIALATLFKQEVAAILRYSFWFSALFGDLREQDPVTKNARLCVNI